MSIRGVALAAMTIALLAGCTSTVPRPEKTETVSPRPTATTSPINTPALPPAPTLRYALTCDELVPPSLLTEAFGDDNVRALTAPQYVLSPIGASVRQHGGLTCTWGNGEPAHLIDGYRNPDYKNLTIHLLPDQGGKWQTYVSTGYPQDSVDQQFASGSGTGCFAHADGTSCSVNVLVGSSWADLLFYGVEVPVGTTDAEFTGTMRPIITRIVERISDRSPTSGARPDPTAPSCEVVLPVEMVRDTLDLAPEEALQIGTYAGGYSLLTAAGEYSGLQRCIVNGSEEVFATASVLPGGAWVFTPDEVAKGIGVGTEKVAVAGTSADSYLDCARNQTERCTVDLAVADDWVRVSLFEEHGESVTDADRDALLALGAAVVANLD